MGTIELYSKSDSSTPLRILSTHLAQKEQSDDQLQTCAGSATEIMVIPRARRLSTPQNPMQTFTPLDDRSDVNVIVNEVFDEKSTQQYLSQFKDPKLSEQSLRPGWLYLFKDGNLWKEFQVTNDLNPYGSETTSKNTSDISNNHPIMFSEIEIIDTTALEPGDKSADIRPSSLIQRTHLLIPKDIELQVAWSEVQWGQSRIQQMGDASIRNQRCTALSLAGAQACSDGTQVVYSSETYQLYADPTLPQWLCDQVPEQFGTVCTMQPSKHVITVVLDDYLEIGRELSKRYQKAVASHSNLISELKNAKNTGSYPSGKPENHNFRFARWFDSALFSYQQFFSADSNNESYFSKTHNLHGFRSQLDINDIYVALGMNPRRLVRAYTEQCQWQLINFIRGHIDATALVKETNNSVVIDIQQQLKDYLSLPALADVMQDADGNPFTPVECDDLRYIATLFHRIGEVARMKDVTIDGNKKDFVAAKKSAEKHACVTLLFEINGDDSNNPWYEYILHRTPTNTAGETEESASKDKEFLISRRFGHLITKIINELLGPHLSADRERLLKTKDRLIELLSGKIGLDRKISLEKINNVDGGGWNKENNINKEKIQKYLLSQVIRPDMVDYPKKEDTGTIKFQRKAKRDAEIQRINDTKKKIKPEFDAGLNTEIREAESAAKAAENEVKQRAISEVKSTQKGINQQKAARDRLNTYREIDLARKNELKKHQTQEIEDAQKKADVAKTQKNKLIEKIEKLENSIADLDNRIADISNQHANGIISAEEKFNNRTWVKNKKISLDRLLGFKLPGESIINNIMVSSEKKWKTLIQLRNNETKPIDTERSDITKKIDIHNDELIIAKSQYRHQSFITGKKQAALNKTLNDISTANQRFESLVDAHNTESERLKGIGNNAKEQYKATSKSSQERLKKTYQDIKNSANKKRQRFNDSFERELEKIETRYQETLTEIDRQAKRQHSLELVKAKNKANKKGTRLADPQSLSLKERLRAVKSGKYAMKEVFPTNSSKDYQVKKAMDSKGTLVLTPTESLAWDELKKQKVHVVSVPDDIKNPTQYIIPKEATESIGAHKERVGLLSVVMVGFEAITLINAIETVAKEDHSLRQWANVVGGIFDTGDAIIAAAAVFMERKHISNMLNGADKAKSMSTLATVNAAAAAASVIANFYSATLCYLDYQERALSHSDSRYAFAMKGIGFTVSGVGALILFITGSVAATIPILGLALIAVGTAAYYYWWKEDLPVLEMWLQHGPFSASGEALLNYSGSDYQIRLYRIKIAADGITTEKYYAFRDEDAGRFLMPIELFNAIGTNADVIVLRNRDYIQEQTIWIDPENYRLLAVDNPAPYTTNRANEGRGWLMSKEEQGQHTYFLDQSKLGQIGDIIGQQQFNASDDRAVLEYLTPEKEHHAERFIQLGDSSQKDKVDPSEWEKDGERCLDALKAGLYPAEVELRMWHKGTEDTNKNHNAQHAYMNAVYGTTKIPTGNVAVVRLTLPYDIDEGDLITVMLMRYDKGLPIIGEDKFFAICSISFTFSNVSEYQKNMDGAGVITSQGAKLVAKPSSNANNKQYINGISIHDLGEVSVKADSAFKAHQILAVFDLDNVENLDPSDKSKELYEYNSNVEFEAWMSYNRTSSKSTRPYRTENSHTNIQNKLDTWEDLSSTSFYAIDRIGWFLSPSVEYTMVGANISPPLIKYSPGNPFYLTEI